MQPYHHTLSAMHTRMDIVSYAISPEQFEQLIFSIQQEIRRIENLISRYVQDSPVHLINQAKEKNISNIDPELFDLLNRCKRYQELTLQYFDIAVNTSSNTSNNDDQTSIKQYFIIDEKNHSLKFLQSPDIDLGGIGKGYALEKIKPILSKYKIENILISFGESSILATGHHPYGDCWKIGVSHPEKKESIHQWSLRDQCLSTSTSSGGHIINPKTGEAVKLKRLVSVMSANAEEAEAISTALVAAEKSDIEKIKNNFSSPEIVIFDY